MIARPLRVARLLSAGLLVVWLTPGIVPAQTATVLSSYDIYLFTRLAKKPPPSDPDAPTHVCGFQIRGNHRSHDNPRVEWDFNIDQIEAEGGPIAGVTAGSFDVVGHDRKPRPAIVDLSFSVEGDPEPIPARIVGSPNADNGIKAALEARPAYELFAALGSDEHLVTIALKFADASSATVQIRGNHDWRKFGGGKNSFFEECLRGRRPPGGYPRLVP
jgi:hypothetical protein